MQSLLSTAMMSSEATSEAVVRSLIQRTHAHTDQWIHCCILSSHSLPSAALPPSSEIQQKLDSLNDSVTARSAGWRHQVQGLWLVAYRSLCTYVTFNTRAAVHRIISSRWCGYMNTTHRELQKFFDIVRAIWRYMITSYHGNFFIFDV